MGLLDKDLRQREIPNIEEYIQKEYETITRAANKIEAFENSFQLSDNKILEDLKPHFDAAITPEKTKEYLRDIFLNRIDFHFL